MFRNMPLILGLMILSLILLDSVIPLSVKSFLFAMGLSIKSFILFLLPFIIFSLLFKTAVQLASHATKIILFIFACVCCSNFLSTFLSHFVGMWVYDFDHALQFAPSLQALSPLWEFDIPKLISNDKAMLGGIILGIAASKILPQIGEKLAVYLEKTVTYVLKIITWLLPLFVAGFVVKLQHDGHLALIGRQYGIIFLIILCAQFGYILLVYFLASLKFNTFLQQLQNMLPATIAGFSTMSSAAAMPLTLIGTQKNANNPLLARAVIPATVNIHLIGDCFAIPILAYAILKTFGMPEPTLAAYLVFALYFVLAKFSVAAVPGGGIIVMLPILESYLGFNAQMMSLITALYILFDPVITSANVLGNGGFALVVDKCQGVLTRPKEMVITQE